MAKSPKSPPRTPSLLDVRASYTARIRATPRIRGSYQNTRLVLAQVVLRGSYRLWYEPRRAESATLYGTSLVRRLVYEARTRLVSLIAPSRIFQAHHWHSCHHKMCSNEVRTDRVRAGQSLHRQCRNRARSDRTGAVMCAAVEMSRSLPQHPAGSFGMR